MPKADATGLAPKKSADHNPPAHDSLVREGLASTSTLRCFYFPALHGPSTIVPSQNRKPISLVKSLSGGLGLKTRRPPGCLCRALRIPPISSLFSCWDSARDYTGEYPIPLARSVASVGWLRPKSNPRNRSENSLTPSGENSVTRYSQNLAAEPVAVAASGAPNRFIPAKSKGMKLKSALSAAALFLEGATQADSHMASGTPDPILSEC